MTWPSKPIRTLVGSCLVLATGASVAAAEGAGDDPAAPEALPPLHRELDRASDFAPAGVLLDHTHARGDWTFLYRYERSSKNKLMQGKETLSSAAFGSQYPGYASTPLSQINQAHTFGVMYAPHERFTLAMLLPFVQNRLERLVPVDPMDPMAGSVFDRQETSGIGDARFILLLPFMQKGSEKTQFNVAVSLPTGSIRVDDSQGNRLPYSMQHGTGSWDIHWGLTYTGKHQRFSWGAQVESQYRLTDNDLGYEVGAAYQASGWLAAEVGDWLSLTARLGWTKTENIKGADPALDPAFSPLQDPGRQAGTRVEMGPGVNLLLPIFGGQRLSFEALFPVHQSVAGPQLVADVRYTAGWQWIF